MQKIRRKKKRVTDAALRRAVLFTVVFIVFVLLFGAAAVFILLYGQNEGGQGEKSFVSAQSQELSGNILLIGRDSERYEQAAFLLMRLDFEANKVIVTALPTELSADAGKKSASLREQARYGGVRQAVGAVQSLLDIKIGRYGLAQLGAFEPIIDRLGGVNYQVPRQITFTGEDGGAGAALEPGLQKLTGAMAIQMILHDDWPEGEIYRLQVQENIAVGLLNGYLKKDFLSNNAVSLFKFASNSVTTDFSMTDFILRTPGFLKIAEQQIPASAASVSGAFSQGGTGDAPVFSITPASIAELHAVYAGDES